MTYRQRSFAQNDNSSNEHAPDENAWLALVPVGAGGVSYDYNALKVGDLIVSTSNAWISERIRNHTNSPVSHLSIYVGDGQVIEAIGRGVVMQPLTSALDDDYYAAAFRSGLLTDAQRDIMKRWLRSQVGRRYDHQAIGTLLTYQNPEAWYCSELVFAAFQHVGIDLVANPSTSTPGDLLRIGGVSYLGHLKYPPNVASQGLFTPSESDRDAMISPGQGGMSIPTSVLQIGDLVVTSSDNFVGAAIRTATGEPASHVALYIGEGEVIEAILEGTVRRPLANVLQETYYATGYRYRGLTTSQQAAIRSFAIAQVGTPYDLLAIASLQNRQDSSAWFCSELVFAAYDAAGIHLGDPTTSSPGDVITMSGFEYLGHLPAAGYVQGQSLARRRIASRSMNLGTAVAVADLISGVIQSPSNADITYSFDQMRGKYSKLVDRWSSDEQVAHDAPIYPYRTVNFTSTQKHWDLGTIGATVPMSFEYNGYYISNFRIDHPIDQEETFGYKLNIAGSISLRENIFRTSSQTDISRVDARLTYSFDYEWLLESLIDDVFQIVEEYRVYSNGTVMRRVTAEGGIPVDRALFIEGDRVIFGTRIPSSQSLTANSSSEPPVMHSVYYQSEWRMICGSGNEPTPQEDAPALIASAAAVQQLWRRSGRALNVNRGLAKRERAIQLAVANGFSAPNARAFFARKAFSGRRAMMPVRPLEDATVYFPEVEIFDRNSATGRTLTTLVEEALNTITPDALLEYCTNNNVCIGIGAVGGGGLGAAFDVGVGIVFAPRNRIGFYGSFSFGGGWNFELAAGLQLTYIYGDETVFAGESLVVGGSVDISEGPGVGARVILNTRGDMIGWTIEAGLSLGIPGISAIEATISHQSTVTTFARQSGNGLLLGRPTFSLSQSARHWQNQSRLSQGNSKALWR